VLPIRQLRAKAGPDCKLTDEQLLKLAGEIGDLANVLLDVFETQQPRPRTGTRAKAMPQMRLVPAQRREEAEERAAIREFDGG
jgi:hypothetical protein